MISIRRALPKEAAILTEIALAAKVHWGYPQRWMEIWTPQLAFSREVIVAPSGNIYTSEMKQTDYNTTNGFWIGQTETRDGSKIDVTTVNGQLYEFGTVTETFKDPGYMLPSEDVATGRRLLRVNALAMTSKWSAHLGQVAV